MGETSEETMECSQSSQVRCAFWQWKQALLAFFFLGPSRVRGAGALPSALSLAPSVVRFRFAVGFLDWLAAEPEGMGVLFSEAEEEEGSEGC